MAKTATPQFFSRVQIQISEPGRPNTVGPVYDIGVAVEDGNFYVWERKGNTLALLGGPFALMRNAQEWAQSLVVPPDGRTPAF